MSSRQSSTLEPCSAAQAVLTCGLLDSCAGSQTQRRPACLPGRPRHCPRLGTCCRGVLVGSARRGALEQDQEPEREATSVQPSLRSALAQSPKTDAPRLAYAALVLSAVPDRHQPCQLRKALASCQWSSLDFFVSVGTIVEDLTAVSSSHPPSHHVLVSELCRGPRRRFLHHRLSGGG